MQPKLSEECRQSSRHAKISGNLLFRREGAEYPAEEKRIVMSGIAVLNILGGHIVNPERGGQSHGCVRQHVRPQQLETWQESKEAGSNRRYFLKLF
jgi:hypothetical protein